MARATTTGETTAHKMTAEKRRLRKVCWARLLTSGADRFPGVVGRTPNFVGAEAAAELLGTARAWRRAKVLECDPDSPQRPARYLALKSDKTLYLAVPRLSEREPFVRIDPRRLDPGELWAASSVKGALRLGRPVRLREVEPIDLVLTGCVGVAPDGARLGKGGGATDLAYALLREAGLATARTPVATTVHACQALGAGELPMEPHDVALDLYATQDELVACERAWRRPRGVLWDELDAERRAAIPVLARGRL